MKAFLVIAAVLVIASLTPGYVKAFDESECNSNAAERNGDSSRDIGGTLEDKAALEFWNQLMSDIESEHKAHPQGYPKGKLVKTTDWFGREYLYQLIMLDNSTSHWGRNEKENTTYFSKMYRYCSRASLGETKTIRCARICVLGHEEHQQ